MTIYSLALISQGQFEWIIPIAVLVFVLTAVT